MRFDDPLTLTQRAALEELADAKLRPAQHRALDEMRRYTELQLARRNLPGAKVADLARVFVMRWMLVHHVDVDITIPAPLLAQHERHRR